MRPTSMLPKPTSDEPKQKYQASVETGVNSSDLTNRALDANITLSTRELLAASPEVRKQFKDIVTSKKVSANLVEDGEASLDTYLAHCFDTLDAPPIHLDLARYDAAPCTAAVSLPLRVIFPTFAPGVEPECILDGGAQIVVMRKDIWEKMRAPIVTTKSMAMESANSGTVMTIGLIENFPVRLGPVTINLQIQVVEDAPFEVLLGRPFFDITNCHEISRQGGSHEISITDPKDGTPYMFPTHPRVRKTPRPLVSDVSNQGTQSRAHFHQ